MGRPVKRLWRGLAAAFADERVRSLVALAVALIAVASLFYWYVEGWSLLDAVYFSAITIATVGYGDFAPQTAWGKVFTIFYVFCGLGIFVAAATSIADSILRPDSES
jgi:voltage-gated potassium channel